MIYLICELGKIYIHSHKESNFQIELLYASFEKIYFQGYYKIFDWRGPEVYAPSRKFTLRGYQILGSQQGPSSHKKEGTINSQRVCIPILAGCAAVSANHRRKLQKYCEMNACEFFLLKSPWDVAVAQNRVVQYVNRFEINIDYLILYNCC